MKQINIWSFLETFSLFSIVQFPNQQCTGASSTSTYGTCYTSSECTTKGGSADGNCAAGFGVCCKSFYFIRIIKITFWEIVIIIFVKVFVLVSNIVICRCDLHHLMWHQHLHQHHLHQEPQLPQLLHPHQHWNMSVHHQQSLRWCLPAQTGLPDILWLHCHLQRWRLHWLLCCGWKIWEEPPEHLWNQHRLSQ